METKPLTPAERVALLIKELEISSYQFGKATGISHQTLSNVMTGKNKPGLDTLQAIADVYPAAAIFLLTGKGQVFPEGRYNEKPPAPSTEAEKPAAAAVAESPAARPDTVRHADTVLKLASVEAENQQLRERLEDAKEEILWLRGKSRTSPDAAGPQNLAALPAPNAIGYHACAQRRAAEFDEYVAVRQEEGGVAELV